MVKEIKVKVSAEEFAARIVAAYRSGYRDGVAAAKPMHPYGVTGKSVIRKQGKV